MTAVLKPYESTRPSLSRRSATPAAIATLEPGSHRRPRSRAQLTALPTVTQQTVRSLPQPQSPPVWLRLLLVAQRGSSSITFCLVALTLVIYGWTVYSQQLWSQNYRRLESLQRQERQMTAANEVLKDQIAREAEAPAAGLVMPSSNHMVFLSPAAQRPAMATPVNPPPLPLAPAKPLGY